MAAQAQHRILVSHTGAIVGDRDEPCATAIELDLDRVRTRIERILDHFFEGGRGPFDHLTGSDLAGDLFGQYMYDGFVHAAGTKPPI